LIKNETGAKMLSAPVSKITEAVRRWQLWVFKEVEKGGKPVAACN